MSDTFPKLHEIAFCDSNPILADRLLHVFRSDDWLPARITFTKVKDLIEALNSLKIDILVLDPSQDAHLHRKWENVIAAGCKDCTLADRCKFRVCGHAQQRRRSVGLADVRGVCEIIGHALAAKTDYHSAIIRSTIMPGTMETVCIPELEAASGLKAGVDFGVGYYPEFLRESTAIEDYDNPGLIVFGALDKPTFAILNLLNKDMPCVANEVDLRTAEMVKYTSNTWRAVTTVLTSLPVIEMRRRAGVTVVFSGSAGAYSAFRTENLYSN